MRSATLLALLAVVGGCHKGYDQSQMAKLTASEQGIVGKYELKTEFQSTVGSGPGSADMRDLLEVLTMLEGGKTTLECFPSKEFTMLVGETPVNGGWSLDQANLRLRIDKVGEMRPDQISKVELENRGVSGWNMTPDQREKFLSAYRNSIALERAESLAKLRVGADGTLYSDGGRSDSIFGNLVSYFQKKVQK